MNTKNEAKLDARSSIEKKGDNCKTEFGENVRLLNCRILMAEDSELVVGNNTILRGYIAISSGCKVVIGERTKCNYPIHVVVSEKTSLHIGNDCLLSDATIYTSDTHSIFCRKTGQKINLASDVFIDDRVWLGRKSWVMKGANIESNVVVAAGAMVTGNIPSHSICAGVPAKIIKEDVIWCDERVDTLPEKMKSMLL